MKRILSFFGALLVLLGVSAPAMADWASFQNGYYYITAMYGSEERAIYSNNTKLAWEPIERSNPAFVFYLEKASSKNEYYMQSLIDGNWFGTVAIYYSTECNLSKADRKTVIFDPNSDGETYKWRPSQMRWDYSNPDEYKIHGNFGFDGNKDRNGDGTPDIYHALGQWGGADWKIEAVPEAELNTARMSLTLRKAFDVYNSAQLYTVGTDPLITNVDATADPATGEPSQFFAICQRTDDSNSSFANLIDGNADDNHFQSTWTTETGVTKYDQWLQVDVSADGTDKEVAGFQLKLGLRSNAWGSAQQPTDITLYATNDETIAKDADISSIQTVASTDGWVKIGDFNLPYDKALEYTKGNDGEYLATINGDKAKNRWLTKDIVLMGNKYRFLRFYMNQMAVNNSDNHQFTFSQFQLYEIANPAVSDAQKDKVDALKSLIEDSQAKVKAGTVTADDITAVEAAIEAVQNSKSQALTNLENLLDSIASASITLNPGVGPGQNDTTKVQAYNTALAAAQAAVHAAHSDAEYTQYGDELRATLAAAKVLNPMTDGYYNIVSAYSSFYEKKAMEARPGEKVMGWNTYKAKSSAQLFKITGLGDGTYSIQNVQTGQYFGTVAGQNQNPVMTDKQETGQTITAIADAATQFNIANASNSTAYSTQYNESGQNKRGLIYTLDGGKNSASAWTLIKVSDQALIDSLVAAAPLAQAKALAAQEIDAAESVKNAAKGYKKGKALITNADDTDADSNQFFTTCETSDDYSAYAHLIDGDLNTCFQSTWIASEAEAPQWLQVDLKDHPVKNFNIYWGLRNGYWGARETPTDITLYVSNDDATAKDEQINTLDKLVATGKWTKICDFTFDQNVPMTTYNGSNRSVSKDINDKMDQTYRYLRFFFNDTYRYHGANQDYTIGEFQIYENTIDEATSPVSYVNGLQAAVDAMMTKAEAVKAASEAGTLTIDDVNQLAELRKAAEALTPDASQLQSAYDAAKTYTDNFEVGTQVGDVTETQWNDMQSALTAAKAVLDQDKPSRTDQDAQVDALNKALAAFKAAQIMPETGKWYFIASRDKTRKGSIQVNGEGENEGVAHENNIYSTFIYGNVAYAKTDNSIDAAGNWGNNHENILYWGYYEAGTGKGGSLGQGEYEGMADPHTMWRIAPIEGQEGTYSIQCRANGLYIGNYSGSSWQTLSATPAPFVIELLGSGQVGLHEQYQPNWLQFAGDGYVYAYNSTSSPNTQWAFALEPVPTDIEALSVYIPDNNIQIMSLPYDVPSDYVSLNADAGINVYGIKGLQIVNGDSTLLLTKKTEIAASEPFIVIANDYTSFDATNVTTTPFSVPLPDEYVRESKSVNGLVSLPDYTMLKKPGQGYFLNSVLTATTSSTPMNAFTGYIDINSVPVFTTETQADATISLAGKGIDAIKGITANGKVFNIYTIDGKLVKKNATSTKGLGKGIYILGNKKVAVR